MIMYSHPEHFKRSESEGRRCLADGFGLGGGGVEVRDSCYIDPRHCLGKTFLFPSSHSHLQATIISLSLSKQ